MLARKYRVHLALILLALAIIVAPYYLRQPDDAHQQAAMTEAAAFLALVDAGQYAQSWQAASPYLHEQIDRTRWEQQLREVREATGALRERQLKDAGYSREQRDGVPPGDYIMLSYAADFTRKGTMKETVTLKLEDAGQWRVVGYFIE